MKQNRKTYYESLYELAGALNLARSPEDVINATVKAVAKAMGAKGCSIMLLTPEGKVLLHAEYGLSDWFIGRVPVSAGKSMSLDGKPVAVLDVRTDNRIRYQQMHRLEGINSALSTPLKLREEEVGVMRVYTAEPRSFSHAAIAFANAAANFVAIALENARFYETLRKDYETLREELLQERAELGDEWMTEEDVTPPEEATAPVGGIIGP